MKMVLDPEEESCRFVRKLLSPFYGTWKHKRNLREWGGGGRQIPTPYIFNLKLFFDC
jgi:hypothetical protein